MLSISSLVNVTVSLTPAGAPAQSFGVLMIAGDSNVISGAQRFRSYSGANAINQVANDFGTTAPEYTAALRYFGQSPQPLQCMIGRWFRTASSALNIGGILTVAQSALSAWTSITSGGFDVTVDGTAYALTALNFSSQTNLNGVASVITAALGTAGSSAVCTWNGTNFQIASGITGAGVMASGTATFTTNPAVSDTITLNALAITFVASGATGNQVNIGATPAATAAALAAFCTASVNADLTPASYSSLGNVFTVTYKTVGTAGNSYSMTKSSSAITLSGADLSGGLNASAVAYATAPGSGVDISAQLGLTSATSQALVAGYNSETALACAQALLNASNNWYGLTFAASTQPSTSDYVAVAGLIEAEGLANCFGVTTQDPNTLSSLVTTDVASQLKALGYNQTVTQYSSTNPYAVCSFLGRAFSVDFEGSDTTIDLMFKQEPGVIAENLTPAQAAVLQSKNCNVFVQYNNTTSIIQYGVVASGNFFDAVQGLGWFQNALETAGYNLLYTTTTKIPQTDAGSNQVVNALSAVCNQAVANGLLGPGTWNGPNVGQIVTGQFLKAGYYIYIQPIALQSQADRAARKCPPISIAAKGAGAIQSANIAVLFNQ